MLKNLLYLFFYKVICGAKENTSIISDGDLKSIWRIVIKNWYIPILVTPIFFLIGYFYIYKLTNVYQASVELLKKNDSYYKGNLISDQGGGFYGSSKTYIDNSNEMRILRSHDLMKTVVYKLKDRLEVSYYIVGRVRTTEQFIGMPFMVRVNSVNSNMHETSIKFNPFLNICACFSNSSCTLSLIIIYFASINLFLTNVVVSVDITTFLNGNIFLYILSIVTFDCYI